MFVSSNSDKFMDGIFFPDRGLTHKSNGSVRAQFHQFCYFIANLIHFTRNFAEHVFIERWVFFSIIFKINILCSFEWVFHLFFHFLNWNSLFSEFINKFYWFVNLPLLLTIKSYHSHMVDDDQYLWMEFLSLIPTQLFFFAYSRFEFSGRYNWIQFFYSIFNFILFPFSSSHIVYLESKNMNNIFVIDTSSIFFGDIFEHEPNQFIYLWLEWLHVNDWRTFFNKQNIIFLELFARFCEWRFLTSMNKKKMQFYFEKNAGRHLFNSSGGFHLSKWDWLR